MAASSEFWTTAFK